MVSILHKVGIKSPASDVYRALTTLQGLAGWWTTDTRGSSNPGEVIEFYFGRGRADMKVLELEPEKQVVWQVIAAHPEWIGSKVSFELKPEGEHTTVLFRHEGWKEPSEFMHHCSTKWATFMLSLKAFVETGKGAPFPNDVQISLQ